MNLGWRGVNPQEELSKLLDGIPVKSGNDAMWRPGRDVAGRRKGLQRPCHDHPGTGVGGGVIIGQKIVAGRHGLGGEIGISTCGTRRRSTATAEEWAA